MIDSKINVLQMTCDEISEICEICSAANAKLADIKSLPAFICALAIIIDQWTADTEADPDEVQKHLINLVGIRRKVTEQLGPCTRNEYGGKA